MPNGDKAMRLDEGKILYDDLAQRIKNLPSVDNVVAVTDVEPTEEGVKIWLPETPPQAIQVPTYAEFQELAQDVDSKVSDVQVNGTSVVNDGVANVPVASDSSIGVIKVESQSTSGLTVDSTTKGLRVAAASSNSIKQGTSSRMPVTPYYQHESAFYGLAKAAGDATQSASSNAVGTYTPEAQAAINTMVGSVSKDSIDNAGITDRAYTTAFGGEFTVTTETTGNYISAYARLTSTGNFDENYLYRVTVNDIQYILPVKYYFDQVGEQSTHGHNIIMYKYVGNISLYINNATDIIDEIYDVPFIIITGRNNVTNENGSIDVLTETAGVHTILVEKIIPTQKKFPTSLIYGTSYYPVEVKKIYSINHPVSIGVNEISNDVKGSYAIGSGNIIEENYGFAAGNMNLISGVLSSAVGRDNTVSGSCACAMGNETVASGDSSFSCGEETTASGRASHSEGGSTIASGQHSHAEGNNTRATLDSAHAEGINTIAAGPYSHAEGNASSTGASAVASHAEGAANQANGSYSHAEGQQNVASGAYSHAEGRGNNATSSGTHVEGRGNVASASYAHAEGYNNIASGAVSHAEGNGTIANHRSQNASGEFNIADGSNAGVTELGTYANIVGNGADDNNRSNAYALDWNGNGHYMGNVYVGCNSDSTGGTMLPTDVQVNGTSVVSNGVANIPVATDSVFGAVMTNPSGGVDINSTTGKLRISNADNSQVRSGTDAYKPITPSNQHKSVFYGLAKVAGADMASSSNEVGIYTPAAQSAIQTMLGVEQGVTFVETVTGTTPTITGQPNVRYICGEVSLLTITPPSAGTITVIFESGSTPTVLTLPNTVKFPEWVDISTLEANTTYEIIITDGVYGGVMSWAD